MNEDVNIVMRLTREEWNLLLRLLSGEAKPEDYQEEIGDMLECILLENDRDMGKRLWRDYREYIARWESDNSYPKNHYTFEEWLDKEEE